MTDRSFYVLAYDICDNKRRARLAKWMEAIGDRVQGSVFEAWLTEEELAKLLVKAKKKLVEDEDSLRVYPICAACRGRVKHWGQIRTVEEPGAKIV